MTTSAIIMMIVAILILWGGLLVAGIHLFRRADNAATDDDIRAIESHRDL